MSGITTFLPKYDASLEQNAEILRQSLPLMMKNKVSTDPINYAIWYEYVSGNNGKLKQELDALVSSKQVINSETGVKLYKNYICNASIESFENINAELQKILNDTTQSVNLASDQVSKAGDSFQQSSKDLQNTVNIADVKAVISQVIAETQILAATSQSLNSKLEEANQEMEKMRTELVQVREIAITDALTGLLNRRAFDDALSDLMSQPAPDFCLVILDLDHFKKINDTFGHLMGDKVLRYSASVMKQNISENHLAARYGGEELAVILPDAKLEEAIEIAENIRKSIEKNRLKRKDDGEPIGKITLSAGVSKFKAGDSVETLIERADKALYEAKTKGRNRVVVGEV